MMMRTRSIAGPGTMMAVTMALLASTPASSRGDVVEAEWNSNSDFRYFIYHMPDFDQKRSILANDGSMYCVPTSATNLMAYIGNHGFPEVSPGSGDWQAQANYATISSNINFMGLLMGTDAIDGTGGAGHIFGLQSWLPSDKFVATYMSTSGTWAPKIQDLAGSAITGALVNFCYGRYDITGNINGFPVISRDSGHCVTLSRIDVDGGNWLMWVRNPSHNGGDLVTQSIFANQELFPAARVAIPDSILPAVYTRTYTELLVEGSAQLRLIDSYSSVRTKQGYSFDDTGGTAQVLSPFGNLAGSLPSYPFDLPPTQTLRELIPQSDGLGFAALVDDSELGVQLAVMFTAIGPSVQRGSSVEVDGGCAMVLGDNRMLYVLCGSALEMIDPDDRLRKLKRVMLPWACDKVMYDDERDQVFVFPAPGSPLMVLVFPKDLSGAPSQKTLPPGSLPTIPSVGACGPDGTTYIAAIGNGMIYGIPPTFDSYTSFQVGAITSIDAIDVDDQGHLFIVSGGMLNEAVPDGEGGWNIDRDSAWDGQRVGQFFKIDRSRTNFDPNDPAMVEVASNTVPDDSEEDAQWGAIADCLADADGDQMVGVTDLLGMLAAWGTNDLTFDIAPAGGDDVVDVLDLLEMLSVWGTCYP